MYGWHSNLTVPRRGGVWSWSFDGLTPRRRRCDSLLHGLDAGQHYRIDNFDENGTELLSGRGLMQHGLEISLSDAPASAIVQYERQSGGSS